MEIDYPYFFEARTYPLHNKPDAYGQFVRMKAYAGENAFLANSIEQLQQKGNGKFLCGYLAYELNADFEKIPSPDSGKSIAPLQFFEPEKMQFYDKMEEDQDCDFSVEWIEKPRADFSKKEYIETVRAIQAHLQAGDIYELTFCMQLKGKARIRNPYAFYNQLCRLNPAPFSALLKQKNLWLFSASPERFLVKRDRLIASQPIKGTIRRSSDKTEDEKLKKELFLSEKERAENVMIVDLVRNDLSRIAQKNSVEVKELFGLHTFPTVHQLISTIEARVKDDIDTIDILRACFPPGSMTGAPKISAMQIISALEKNKRGLFSGSLGYLTPDGDFDFNVVIRSVIYDENTHEISIPIGGAITLKSKPEAEYEECKLKAAATIKALALEPEDILW